MNEMSIDNLIAQKVTFNGDFLKLLTLFNIGWVGKFLYAASKDAERVEYDNKERTPEEVRQDMLEAIAEMYVLYRLMETRYVDGSLDPAQNATFTTVRFQFQSAKQIYRDVLFVRLQQPVEQWETVEEAFLKAACELIAEGWNVGR